MIDEIIRSRRRTLGLQVTSDARVVVRAPHRATMNEIERWVERNLAWIQKHQTRLRAEMATRAVLSDEERARLEREYRVTAQTIIPPRAAAMAAAAGLSYTSLRINGARTRWGSCSRKGRLNFSWRLAMAPLWVVEYVIAHELAHLVHPNHSKRFWNKVGELHPNPKEARRWLRQNHHKL